MSRNESNSDFIRTRFAAAMSKMYRDEVPAYGTLVDLVAAVNKRTLERHPRLQENLIASDGLERISDERHGAIRVGTAAELRCLRRVFAVMGMYPVSYYDLSAAGIPVHSTAFRPITQSALSANPFRVFTSLLRLELIDDASLRVEAERALNTRCIFTLKLLRLVERAEAEGSLYGEAAVDFVAEALEIFRWHSEATVSHATYCKFHDQHRLIADIVSFRGPHINHLTPRTLDIDAVQKAMPDHGIEPKATIEGPPPRHVPILLRQTSFKALEERISFPIAGGGTVGGRHTARFGEIEARGVALTAKGRKLYDELLDDAGNARRRVLSEGGSQATAQKAYDLAFESFPDDESTLRQRELAYFEYRLVDEEKPAAKQRDAHSIDQLVASGHVTAHPITYEDFLPVSAAGIFQSNLGDGETGAAYTSPNKAAFEEALGCAVLDECALYDQRQRESSADCFRALGLRRSAA